MARTNIPVVTYTMNGSANETAGTVVNAGGGNGHVITVKRFAKLVLEFVCTVAPASAVTIKAGATNPPGLTSGQGDLVVVPSTTLRTKIGPFTGDRFSQSDGTMLIDIAATTAGTVYAYEIGKSLNTQ